MSKVRVTRYGNHHGHRVASEHDRYCTFAAVLHAAIADMGLCVNTNAYVF